MKEYKLKINGTDYAISIEDSEDNAANVEVNGTPFKVEFDKPIKKAAAPVKFARKTTPGRANIVIDKPAVESEAGGSRVTTPLPGVILEVAVKEGQAVKKGQKIVVLEAMKMENVIEATCDGTIKELKVSKSDSVLEGDTIAIIG
ncbi:MAG TPA: biotin/lipoyl-binding protein [Candidatus Egerieousia sp.]|nr:biotin/lipoyl-binding protein [Candidatus Egerieousia sp.]HPT05746.1 biotin/lipoyl-binding protein [Candidatus Egerieousia sp.]